MWVIKWPIAVASLAFLPGSALALRAVFRAISEDPARIAPFLAGFVLYAAVWRWLFRRYAWGSWLSTFEHEFTHALFAFLTGHRVLSIRSSWHDGGATTFRGRGNWLILISPYFFPTISVAVAIVLTALPADVLPIGSAILGVTVAYHGASTWLETHWRQTDLQRVGLPFAFAFLPTANLICYGALLAVAAGGGRGDVRLSDLYLERDCRPLWLVRCPQ